MPDETTPSCPVCGATNRRLARTCASCGVPLGRSGSVDRVDDLLKDLLEPAPEPAPPSPESLDLEAEIVDDLLDSILVDEPSPVVRVECPLCGGEVSADARRCAHCGAEFAEVPLPSAAPSVTRGAKARGLAQEAPPGPTEPRPKRDSRRAKRTARPDRPTGEIPVGSSPTETPHRASPFSGRTMDLILLGTVGALVAIFVVFRMYTWASLTQDSVPILLFLGVAFGGLAAGTVVFRLSTSALSQGDRLVKAGRYQEALAYFDRAIRMGYRVSNAWTSRGVALKRLGHLEEALRCQQLATKLDTDNEIAWCNMGDVYFRLGDFPKALEAYDRAIKIRPKYAIAWNNRGAALARMNRFEEARDCHDRAVRLAPRYVAAWLNRGEILARLGDRAGAQQCLERARALGA